MNDILKLAKLELTKIFKTNVSKAGIILSILIMLGLSFNEFNDIKRVREYNQTNNITSSYDWREREEYLISEASNILSDPFYDESEINQINKRIEIAKYRLEHNIEKDYAKNMWWFVNDNSFNWVFRFIILIVVIVSSFNLASEYNNKTINLWMISPYKRWKILTSKLLASLIYGLLLLGIVLTLGIFSGILLHGFNRVSSLVVLYGISGPYTMSTAIYSIIVVLLKLVELIFTLSLVFLICVLIKSISIATIISIITVFVISPLVLYSGKIYNFLNYLPFNHLDFRKFLDFGTLLPQVNNDFISIVIPNFSLPIAIFIVISYITLFLVITYRVFCKKDII